MTNRTASAVFVILLAGAVPALTNNSVLLDPANSDSAIDLKELPLEVDLWRRAGLAVQDIGLERQLDQEFHDLQSSLEESIKGTDLGALLKVRMYVSQEGAVAVPGGRLLAFEGAGATPVDALANSLRTPALVAPDAIGPPFENQSYYVWIKAERGKLKAGIIARQFRDPLEKAAHEEAERRVRTSKVDEAAEAAGLSTLSKDEYWNKLAEQNLSAIQDSAERARVEKIASAFSNAEHRFQEAYEQYAQKEQELIAEQQRLKTLQIISRVADLVSSGIRLGEIASASGSGPASVTAPSDGNPDPNRTMIHYHEKQIEGLRGEIKQWDTQLEIRGATLQQMNDPLFKTFMANGIDVPDSHRVLILPPRH